MPYSGTWTYTTPAAATGAVPGKVIASADWNTIFLDIQNAVTQLGSNLVQLKAVSFGTSNVDNQLVIVLPTGFTNYMIDSCRIANANHSLSAATVGLFTAAGATGTAIVQSSTAVTVVTSTAGASNSAQLLTLVNTSIIYFTASILYFRIQTGTGVSPSNADVVLHITPIS